MIDRERRCNASRVATVLFASGLLAACATPLSTQVSAFHRLPPQAVALDGQTFRILPGAGVADGLEFASHADRVRQELIRHGAVHAAGGGGAALEVVLRYAETGLAALPQTRGSSGGISIGTGIGGGVGFGFGIGFPIGQRTVTPAPRVRYDLWLDINRSGGVQPASAARLYEGHASADGPLEGGLPRVVPALLRALFADFPGRNGESRRVEVTLDEPARQESARQKEGVAR